MTSGLTYQFQIEAQNAMGYSLLSDSLTILSAEVPAAPVAPVTTISTNTVILDWVAPNDNGSPITAYTVLVKDSSAAFVTELTDCDGSV